jgi:DNA-binding MarR family transcriptional regulator
VAIERDLILNPLELDKIIHERSRLGIMSILAVRSGSVPFKELKQILNFTDGNLNAHIRYLEDAGYINIHKRFIGKKPSTSYSITDKGRQEFDKYLSELEKLLAELKGGVNNK